MKLLLDTHLLLWAAAAPTKLSADTRRFLEDAANELIFSVASIWEVAIKSALSRGAFRADPHQFRRGLLEHGYRELPIKGEHAVAVSGLPAIHADPFDRMLIAQSLVEGIPLMTADPVVARYPASIRKV